MNYQQAQQWHKERAIESARNNWPNAYLDGNQVPRWKSNDRIPPNDILNLWNELGYSFAYQEAITTSQNETKAFLKKYVAAQQARTPEQRHEEQMMARAAHGPGVVLTNVFTRESFTT